MIARHEKLNKALRNAEKIEKKNLGVKRVDGGEMKKKKNVNTKKKVKKKRHAAKN